MGELLFIDVAKRERNLTVQAAWDAYLAARDKADASRKIEDGIEVGKAYRQFLELFAGPKS